MFIACFEKKARTRRSKGRCFLKNELLFDVLTAIYSTGALKL